MDKYFMRFFETEEEYQSAKQDLQYKTLSAIKETKNVYYNVDIHNPYAVVINGGEAHIFEDGIIPSYYFMDKSDITRVTINGDIFEISSSVFNGCEGFTINYYGTVSPIGRIRQSCIVNVRKDSNITNFCGINTTPIL